VTDVTNASRTLLFNYETLSWDDELTSLLGIPKSMLPAVKASSEVYGMAKGDLEGVAVAGDLGDQQAALFGQACYDAGEAKNTYGTGCFMLLNTGTKAVPSKSGLLTTLGYKIGDQPAVYALEGSIAITGALVQWLRDNIGLITSSAEVEALAATVEDNGGVYFVPAFSGLFAPYWKNDARGVIAGLTRYVNKGHIARATLEATAWQTREVLDAMNADSGVALTALKVDGGMVYNELLMQFQSDVLGVPVIRPQVAETTALGAAYAAGLAVGFWSTVDDLRQNWAKDKEWSPKMDPAERDKEYGFWKKAVTRTVRLGRTLSRNPGVPASPARRHANLAEDQDRCPSPGPRRSSGSLSYPILAASRKALSSLPARWRVMTSRSRRWVGHPTARSAQTPTASPPRSAVRITARGS
jgi:glycerol kinase